jgi:hypothetical protein
MARPSSYSPAIDPFLVSALYHEARRKGVPMTKLADELLRGAQDGSCISVRPRQLQGVTVRAQ